MSAPGQSVFISYAREDLAATRRIADALSAFEVQVWFDEEGLEGGDAWDQKIRRQIKECSLFIPIISAQTQARREAYFRLEWKLAEERTHLMAEGTAFLLPIAIDDLPEAGALVPESFRHVQWIRLPRGVPSTPFVDRVRALLEAQRSAPAAPPLPRVERPAPVRRWFRGWWLAGEVLLVAALLVVAFWPAPALKPPAESLAPAPPPKEDKSIAVLPFVNMSDDKDSGYFAEGVHEDVLTSLANLSALKVISRTSMQQYRDTKKPLGQVAHELGVAYLLEGSVRRAGNKVRVTGQLIKAATVEHVWAKSYDRDLTDIFAVQAELAREIAGALHAVLSPAEAAGLEVRPTKNIEAYDCYQKARVLGRSHATARDVTERIIPLLEQAVRLDPAYAAAWAELSQGHMALYRQEDHTEARLAQAKDAITRAERLAPDAHAVLVAGVDFGSLTGNRAMADDRRRRIGELFPDRAESHLLMASNALREARWADARASYREALRLDPRNTEVLSRYYFFLDSLRRWDEAWVVAATLTEIQPDNLEVRLTAASMVFRHTGSTAQLTRLLGDLPRNTEVEDNSIVVRARIAFLTGDWPGLIALWRETGPRFRTGSFSNRSTRLQVAGAFLKVGDPAAARPLLEQTRDESQKLLQANPESIALWTELGVTLGMLGDRTGARAALDKAGERLADGVRPLLRWEYTVARSWVDEKSAVIAEIGRQLREPALRPPNANVYVLRVTWAALPLHGDPEFEAMLKDPRNNAPLF